MGKCVFFRYSLFQSMKILSDDTINKFIVELGIKGSK